MAYPLKEGGDPFSEIFTCVLCFFVEFMYGCHDLSHETQTSEVEAVLGGYLI